MQRHQVHRGRRLRRQRRGQAVHRDVSHQRTGERRPQEEQKGEDDEEEELMGTLWRLLNRKITDLCDKSSPLLAY